MILINNMLLLYNAKKLKQIILLKYLYLYLLKFAVII